MENTVISMFDENGELKDKETFLNEISEAYDSIQELNTEQTYDCYFDNLVDPESQIDVVSTLETFEFLERTIYITDDITPESANSVFEMINFWNRMDEDEEIPEEEREPIKMYINTPGGDIDAVFTIISAIKVSKTPVHTITIGTGYSGGFFIGICGHKRYGLAYSSYLFHEGAAMDSGDAHKFIQKLDFYKSQLKRLKQITLENTKITEEEYEAHKKDDWFMSTNEAIKYGVIDEVLETM